DRAVGGSLAAGSRRREKLLSQLVGVRLGEVDVLHRSLVLEKRVHPTAGVVDDLVRDDDLSRTEVCADAADRDDRYDITDTLFLECPYVGAVVHLVGRTRVTVAVAREEHHRYPADRAESERSGRFPIGGPHHLATRDIETGEPCQPGAADDREHVRSGFLYRVDFRQVAPSPGYVHSAAEHIAVG